MRNLLIGFIFLLSFGLTVISEPIDDVFDAIAGGTNDTYNLTIDSIAGVSTDREDDDEHEDEDEDEDEYEDDD